MKKVYDVVLETSVGKRIGTMDVNNDCDLISGELHILKQAEPFTGKVDDAGKCRIQGNLSTLMRRIPYFAVGKITDQVDLELNCGKETFRLVGKQCV